MPPAGAPVDVTAAATGAPDSVARLEQLPSRNNRMAAAAVARPIRRDPAMSDAIESYQSSIIARSPRASSDSCGAVRWRCPAHLGTAGPGELTAVDASKQVHDEDWVQRKPGVSE